MATYMEISVKDYKELIARVEYAIEKIGPKKPLARYLQEGLDQVTGHVENEKHCEGEEAFTEIDALLDYIGDYTGEDDGQKRDSGSTDDNRG